MKNIHILKREIIFLKTKLNNYKEIIPALQHSRFEKDLKLIFTNLEYSEKEEELKQMQKLANNKLKSMERVYGDLKMDNKDKKQKIDSFIPEKNENEITSMASESNEDTFKPLYNQLKASISFDPKQVKKYQNEEEAYNKLVHEAFLFVQNERQKDKTNINNNKNNKIIETKEEIEKFQESIFNGAKEIAKKHNLGDPDEFVKTIDIQALIKDYNEEASTNDEKRNKQKEEKNLIKNFQEMKELNIAGNDFYILKINYLKFKFLRYKAHRKII